jgi:uncharacterized repeat protein (TIGR04076 family)
MPWACGRSHELCVPGIINGGDLGLIEEGVVAQYRVVAEVKDSRCPLVNVGDRMVVEGTMLNLAETTSVCTVALSAIQYSLFMMGKADDPRDFGRQDVYELQCPDPADRVVFEIRREPLLK